MNPTHPRLAIAIVLLCSVAACDDGTTSAPLPLYHAPMIDAGTFVTGSDAGTDARDGAKLDAAGDAKGDATAVPDAGSDAKAGTDAKVDSATDAAVEGATDAAATPDATDASSPTDSTAPSCSVDADTCAPICMSGAGTTEGWYQGNGTLICAVACAGDTAKCQHVGQVGSQGWYTTGGGGCPPHSTEILNDPNRQP